MRRRSPDSASWPARSTRSCLVNVFAPRWWTDGVNAELLAFAQQYRDVELANWRDSISGQLRLLAGDQIHPGNAGGRVYVGAVRDALQRLSELPPLLGPRDYGLAPLAHMIRWDSGDMPTHADTASSPSGKPSCW